MKAQVLIVDDERLIRSSLERALSLQGHVTETADSAATALAAAGRKRFDLVVLDLKLPDGSGLEVLARLLRDAPDTKVVVISAHGTVDSAVEAMKLGAFDFVKKPFDLDELLTTAQNALRAESLERRVAYHDGRERQIIDDTAVTGTSPAMTQLGHEIAMVATRPVPVVLVVGETGSGKALVARRLHYQSRSASGPFVELNAAAIPETLVESELFGHERGAFSDARERKLGLVEVADAGTLFLDEVGDLGPGPQAKLLTFLESFTFRRIGATAVRTVDIRLVAATNRDLATLVKEGKFRIDLYYRLGALTLYVPPLRARIPDIKPLAELFIGIYAHKYQKRMHSLSPETLAVLERWPWPGNVRELKSVMQRAVLMHDGDKLETAHLPTELLTSSLALPLPEPTANGGIPRLEQVELRYMRAVLALTGGNKLRAAEHLGITRQTLAKRLGDSE
jgi:DNA-binding NtrC family response regulator